MCANNYQNLFKTFVANLCGGNFVSTFDKQRIDGVVTKAEFQEIMYLDENKAKFADLAGWNGEENNTTGYRDLVNSFWNSFDINQEDGKIKGTGLFNLNGLDNTESTDLQKDLNIHKRIADQLVTIQKYPNTYNYLLNQLVKELGNSELESLTPEKINETLNQVITNNSSAIKNILLKDVSNISSKNYTKYNISGFYDVENDPTLKNLLTNSVSQPGDIASLDDITNYFNNSTNTKEINEYFNSKAYSSDNNYQKAWMQKNIYDEVYNYINNSLPSLKNSRINYDETIKEEIEKYINSYKAENGVNLDDLIAEIKNKFFATDENGNSKGQALYDYLYTLSLYDLKEENIGPNKITNPKDKETFEKHLYSSIIREGYTPDKATKIIEWLDDNNEKYQKLIQETAEEILKKGKNLTASEIHALIYEKLEVKSTDGLLSLSQIQQILKDKNMPVTTPETDQEEAKKMPSDGFSIDNLVPTNEAGGLDWTSPTVSVTEAFETAKKKAKERLNEFLESIYQNLKDKYDTSLLNKARENVKSKYNNIIDNIALTLNGFSGPVAMDNYYYQYCAYGNVEDNKINDYCSKELPVTCIVDDWSQNGDYPLRVLILIDGEQLKNNIVDEYNSLLANK